MEARKQIRKPDDKNTRRGKEHELGKRLG